MRIMRIMRIKKIAKRLLTILCFCACVILPIAGICFECISARADTYITVDLTQATCSYMAEMDKSTSVHTTRIAVYKSDADWGHNILQITSPDLNANVFVNGKSVAEHQNTYILNGSPSIDTSDVIIKEYGCAPIYVYFTYVDGYNVIDVCIPEDYLPAASLQSVEIVGDFTYVNEGFEKKIYTLTGKFTTKEEVQPTTPIYTVVIDGISQFVEEGKCAEKPGKEPVKEETETCVYTFLGWFIKDMDTPFDFSAPITSSIEIESRFSETPKYLVTIDGEKQRVAAGKCAISPVAKPTRAEDENFVYLFEGWRDVETNLFFDFTTPIQKDTTLQAVFMSIPKFTVILDGVELTVIDGEKLKEPSEIPTKAETESHTYVFIGWGYVNKNGEVTHWNFLEDTVQSDLVLIADFQAVEKQKFKVTFDPDNGVEATDIWVYDGMMIPLDSIPENPSKLQDGHTRYAFSGWSADGWQAWDFVRTPIHEDVTLRAYYTETTVYTVSFDEKIYEYEINSFLERPVDPVRSSTMEYDYIFQGWYYLDGEELQAWDFEKDRVLFDVALISRFEAHKVRYTFEAHFGAPSDFVMTQEIAWGERIDYPEIIAQTGYEMLGWVDGEGKTAPEIMPLGDVCVYANLQIATYTVTIQLSNGENHYEYFTIENADTLSERLESYFRSIQSELYSSSWREPLPDTFICQSYTFYIDMEKVRYRLTVMEDPERAETATTSALAWDEEIELITPAPVRGKRFLGWKTESGEEVPETMPISNLTVVGVWEWDVYTLTIIDSEGREENISYTAREADDPLYVKALFNVYLLPTDTAAYRYSWNVEIPELLPLESGKIYKIEKVANEYTITFLSAETVESMTFTVETLHTLTLPETPGKIGYTAKWDKTVSELILANTTLTAVYTPITYTLTFAGAVQIEPITFTVETMSDLSLPDIPQKPGYTSQWDKTLSELKLEDTTLTAVYTPILYQLTFVCEGEIAPLSFTVETLPALVLPEVPACEGYEGRWNVKKEELLLEDRTITAIYTPLSYTVTFAGTEEEIPAISFTVETLPYLSFPEVPEKIGYTGNWDRLPSDLSAEDAVVTAIYTPISYKITFEGLEKETIMTFTAETKESILFPVIPGKIGYLAQWDKQPSELLLEDTTVRIVYTPIVYTLTFAGVEGIEPITFTVETIDGVVLPTLPKREGYTAEWDKNLSGIGLENTIVTAVYVPIVYTIVFESEEGRTEQTFTVETLDGLEFPVPPSKEGYTVSWDKSKADVTLRDIVVTAVYTKTEESPVDSSVTESDTSAPEKEEDSSSEEEGNSSQPSDSSGVSSALQTEEEKSQGCLSNSNLSGVFLLFSVSVACLLHRNEREE